MENEKIDWDLIYKEVVNDKNRHQKMRKMNKETLIEYFDYKRPTHRIEGICIGVAVSVVTWLVITGISMCGCA